MAKALDPISWDDDQSYCLLNPRMPEAEKVRLRSLAADFEQAGHIWISSSGSSIAQNESLKLIALSKEAFLASAEAVNEALNSQSLDRWGLALPKFHVGGLSIFARAKHSAASVYEYDQKWDPKSFQSFLEDQKITLCSLVPTQLSDLIAQKFRAPQALRAVVIGGAALSDQLYQEATNLGWPILPSFGMTECCSQIATAKLGSHQRRDPSLIPLKHVDLTLSPEGRLRIKSPSLLTGFAQYIDEKATWSCPLKEGWYESSDFAEIKAGRLIPLGRGLDFVQVGGETVNLVSLRKQLETICDSDQTALLALTEPRLGYQIVLAYEAAIEKDLSEVIEVFNQSVRPYEKIRASYKVAQLPRSELGKIQYKKLSEMIQA